MIEKRITRDEVYCADEAFFTGTAAEVTPIRELDNRTIGSGTRGPITHRNCRRCIFDCVQRQESARMPVGWHTFEEATSCKATHTQRVVEVTAADLPLHCPMPA